MKFKEVLEAFQEGKKIKRERMSFWIDKFGTFNLHDAAEALLADDWEIKEEPKPLKLMAPALYGQNGRVFISSELYELKQDAIASFGKTFISWPARCNSFDGLYRVQWE